MELTQSVIQTLNNAEAKALATLGDEINVVPISSSKVVDNHIWLIDYFFDKTVANIKKNPEIALTFWSGLNGYQIKAHVNYVNQGNDFEKATKWIAEIHPNRLVKGLLILETKAIFDISISNKRI